MSLGFHQEVGPRKELSRQPEVDQPAAEHLREYHPNIPARPQHSWARKLQDPVWTSYAHTGPLTVAVLPVDTGEGRFGAAGATVTAAPVTQVRLRRSWNRVILVSLSMD